MPLCRRLVVGGTLREGESMGSARINLHFGIPTLARNFGSQLIDRLLRRMKVFIRPYEVAISTCRSIIRYSVRILRPLGRGGSTAPCVGGWEQCSDYSCAPAPTATQARSEFDTDSTLKFLAAAAMRINACASGMGGFVSPFLDL